MNEFENDAIKDDQVVEITDLDPVERTSRFSKMFIALEKRLLHRKRFWRIATAGSTFLLILLVYTYHLENLYHDQFFDYKNDLLYL